MKQKDLQKCALCDKGMMHARGMTFYILTIQRMGIDVGAVRRQDALEQMMGGSAVLASVMGPNEDLCVPLHKPEPVWICDPCAFSHGIMDVAEILNARKEYRAKKDSVEKGEGLADAGEHKEG